MLTLKEQKQQFVSDLLGGSLTEIYTVVGTSVASYFTYKSFANNQALGLSIILDFLLNVIVLLSSITVYSGKIGYLYQLLLLPGIGLVILLIFNNQSSPNKPINKSKNNNQKDILTPKPFITAYRSHMLILTNLAILAVDFHIFPRRFAKVETWGTSIMDMGVGSFVFSMGLVNSRSIMKQKLLTGAPKKFNFTSYIQLVITNIKKAMPMIILGIIRCISVKGLEYQEHVTEYGVHWNFFITLGLLPIFIAILDPFFELLPRVVVAICIIIGYELLLNKTDLLTFILKSDNRSQNLITMNKEGLFSFWGYLSIFIFGQSFGSFVLTSVPTANNLITFDQVNKTKYKFLTVSTTKGLMISTILFQGISFIVYESSMFFGVSRRLANLPYVLMIVSYNSFFLLCYNVVNELLGSETTGSKILDSVNKNGLVFFLLGNLLTGLVNQVINTLECTPQQSFGILFLYGLVIVGVSVSLDRLGIYIKL